MLTKDEHTKRHSELHKSLDELAADYVKITGKLLGKTTILELLEWSYSQTINPIESDRIHNL